LLKKNKNKKILIIIAFLVQTIFAQTLYELDVNYGFGASELSYNSVPGIAISIYPIKNFAFSAGLQYSSRWETRTSMYIKDTNSAVIDSEKDSLIFIYSINKFEEELSGNILQIPILLKYSNDSYYAGLGVKIGAVQKASVNSDYSGLETEGYYPQYDLRIFGPTAPISQGFGPQKDSSFKTKISSKNSIMLAMEGGIKAKMNDNFSMLIGIFADYSFNKGFDRDLKPTIERKENKNFVSLETSDRWKSWRPWSVGIAAKLSFILGHNKNIQEETCAIEPTVEKKSVKEYTENPITPPIPVVPMQMPIRWVQQQNDSIIPKLPEFLLNRKVDFMFYYPENQDQANTTDSLHSALTEQIANVLREKSDSQLHCVGYSEKLLSVSVAYETAFQRALNIRSNLTRFYGIDEKRISTYSQGSKNAEYRRTECFVVDPPP